MNRRMKIKKLALTFALFLVIAAISTRSVVAGGQPLSSDSVVFQAFYWNVPEGGNWYNTIAGRAHDLKSAGFTHFWFPPPTKGAGGGYSMGYDLYDHSFLARYWKNQNCGQSNCCSGTDLNNDGSVDSLDLARLLEYWLRSISP